jgi:hypothetical protein
MERPVTATTAIAMMVASIATVALWHVSGYDDDVYKILPGVIAAVLVYVGSVALMRGRAARPATAGSTASSQRSTS